MATTALRRSVFALPVVALVVLGTAISTPAGSAAAKAKRQYGISVFVTDTCPRSSAEWLTYANNEMRGVKAMKANSVALAFPFYTDDVKSNSVYVSNLCPKTNPARVSPTPARLAVIVKAAHKLKLKVVLRPLLDEAHLSKWRGGITPTNAKKWFASYTQLLVPYLKMAQSTKVERFGIMGELNSLTRNKNWPVLVKAAHKIYKGALLTVPTWPLGPTRFPKGTTLGIDAYPRLPNVKPSATVAQVLAGWNKGLKTTKLPPGVTFYEVGINSVDGAYAYPSVTGNGAFNPKIQATWFSAACKFMKQHKYGGIYFWGQWFESNGGTFLTQPNPYGAAQIQPASQKVIKACFAS